MLRRFSRAQSISKKAKEVYVEAEKAPTEVDSTSAITIAIDTLPVTFNSAQPLGIGLKELNTSGVVFVSSVDDGSRAVEQGVAEGMVITHVNKTACGGKSKGEVVDLIKAAKAAGTTFDVQFEMQ